MAYPKAVIVDDIDPKEYGEYRYLLKFKKANLSVKTHPKKVLIAIGVNPSTADENKPDQTVSTLLRIWQDNPYTDFVMLNLYPKRSTNPHELPLDGENDDIICTEIEHNCQIIDGVFSEFSGCSIDFLLAFGNLIEIRKYLQDSFDEIIKTLKKYPQITYKAIALTKKGHPCHPLAAWRCKGSYQFKKYDSKKKNSEQERNYKVHKFSELKDIKDVEKIQELYIKL